MPPQPPFRGGRQLLPAEGTKNNEPPQVGRLTNPREKNVMNTAGDLEVAIQAVRTVWPDAQIIGQWLTADELFPGSGQCKDCGDPLNGPGLMQRCRSNHKVATP
jgi:hypothetical protein